MDWITFAEYGVAIGIALGAKREMNKFRDMFQATLDKLAGHQNTTDQRLDRLEAVVEKVVDVINAPEEVDPETEVKGFLVRDPS